MNECCNQTKTGLGECGKKIVADVDLRSVLENSIMLALVVNIPLLATI